MYERIKMHEFIPRTTLYSDSEQSVYRKVFKQALPRDFRSLFLQKIAIHGTWI
jgi:hypothetical protein